MVVSVFQKDFSSRSEDEKIESRQELVPFDHLENWSSLRKRCR